MPQFWRIVNVVLIVGTVIGILQPALFEQKPFGDLVRSLYSPNTSQEFLMRWLLIFLLFAFIYILIIDIVYKRQGLTIVRTILECEFR
jgi:hypothetical protein